MCKFIFTNYSRYYNIFSNTTCCLNFRHALNIFRLDTFNSVPYNRSFNFNLNLKC